MEHWLFNIGTGKYPPPFEWLIEWEQHRCEAWFPPNKRPRSIEAWDRALVNGSQRRGLLAVVEVVSGEPEPNDTPDDEARKRWPWKIRYRLLAAKCADHNPATLEAAGIVPRSTQRQPFIHLTREQYVAGVRALAESVVRAAA